MIGSEYNLSQPFLAFFRQRVVDGKSLALISVLSTEGSTYSKAGMQMLVDEDHLAQGMLSGGCLEGDLAERVSKVLGDGKPAIVTYDLMDDDNIFGLGLGCEGTMRALIQPLTPQDGYEPLAGWIDQVEELGHTDIDLPEFQVRLIQPCRLLILGAGKDAEPLVSFAQVLGWHVIVFDHRPGNLENAGIQCAEAIASGEPGDVAKHVDLVRVDAAVVMSHNLESDKKYLGALADSAVDFIGLIGPPARRDQLLSELGEQATLFAGRLRAPVGTQIGGRGPAAIALEIVAELQAYFSDDRN